MRRSDPKYASETETRSTLEPIPAVRYTAVVGIRDERDEDDSIGMVESYISKRSSRFPKKILWLHSG